MSTLTDRYVHAATRSLPDDQRADVADELRGSIADRVEALLHLEPGTGEPDAERAALVELGDPEQLAAGYAGRRRQLIGPDLYPSYVKVLKALLVTVVPIVAVVVTVVDAIDGASVGQLVGGAAWLAFIVGVEIAFWVTLSFALVERRWSGELAEQLGDEWKPEDLPALPEDAHRSVGELVTSLVWIGFVGAAIVWQQYRSPVGDAVPLLDPDLWSFWLPLILALLVVEAAFELVKYRASAWTVLLAAINTALSAAFTAPLVYLAATDRLLNPEAISEIQSGWSGFSPDVTNTVVIITALAIWVFDTVDGWRHALAD